MYCFVYNFHLTSFCFHCQIIFCYYFILPFQISPSFLLRITYITPLDLCSPFADVFSISLLWIDWWVLSSCFLWLTSFLLSLIGGSCLAFWSLVSVGILSATKKCITRSISSPQDFILSPRLTQCYCGVSFWFMSLAYLGHYYSFEVIQLVVVYVWCYYLHLRLFCLQFCTHLCLYFRIFLIFYFILSFQNLFFPFGAEFVFCFLLLQSTQFFRKLITKTEVCFYVGILLGSPFGQRLFIFCPYHWFVVPFFWIAS